VSTRILDIELSQPLPAGVDTDGCRRLLLVAWRRGVPVGTREIPAAAERVGKEQLAAALADFAATAAADDLPSADTELPLASVVVCTCRRPAELTRCLEALQAQAHPRFEIVVVDNDLQGSAAATVRGFQPVRYCHEQRPGIRFARNRGVAEAAGEIVAFIDDDCLPVPGWLHAVADSFARRPELGCCTGPVLPAALDTPAREWLEARGGFNRGFVRRLHTRDSGRRQWPSWPLQAWMFGSGGNMAFRRAVLRRLGAFDEILPTAEDLDIFFRILHAGHELLYEPAAAVRHCHVATCTALRRRLYLWGWGYVAYLLKIACRTPDYRRRALAEIAGWFAYQLRDRLWAQLIHRRGDFPLRLIVTEIAGGVAAIPGYLLLHARRPRDGVPPFLPATK
jgi:GT2 family glycosyltransferase